MGIALVDIRWYYKKSTESVKNTRIFPKWHLSLRGSSKELLVLVEHHIFWGLIYHRLDAQTPRLRMVIILWGGLWGHLSQNCPETILKNIVCCKVKTWCKKLAFGTTMPCLIVCHSIILFSGDPQWGCNDNFKEAVDLSPPKRRVVVKLPLRYSFPSPYLRQLYLYAYPPCTFAICHRDSKLRSSESIHSPGFAEYRIILAVSAALWVVTVKNGGRLQIFQTCIFKGQ